MAPFAFPSKFTAILGLASVYLLNSRALVPPSLDPFYTPPVGYENTAPGTILRYRTPLAPIAALGTFPVNLKAAYQLLYRTTDTFGNPEATVTTILVPNNANYSRLVSKQDFEDSSWINCATSYGFEEGSSPNTTLSQADNLIEYAMLEEGWVLNVPDFEGPEASFGNGIQAAYSVLDSVRAALASRSITGISQDADVVMSGYSGGSIGTEWAAEFQPSYAPELKILGAAIGGTIVNLTSVTFTINECIFAGFIPTAVVGLVNAYTNLTNFLNEYLVPSTAAIFMRPATQCAITTLPEFAGQDIGNHTNCWHYGSARDASDSALFYKAIGDEISPVADNDNLVSEYCAKGVPSVRYDRNAFGEHVTEAILGVGAALSYIKDRFDGVPSPTGCQINEVVIQDVDLGDLDGDLDLIEGGLSALLGLPIRPESVAVHGHKQ